MDRYQFEDAISDYIENQLDLKSRKEFEEYLMTNPEARDLVESVKKTIHDMNEFKSVKTSAEFMAGLQKRLKSESVREISVKSTAKRTIFGLEPLYAGISAFTFAGIIFVAAQMFTTTGTNQPSLDPSLLGASRNNPAQLQDNNPLSKGDSYFAGKSQADSSQFVQDSLKPLSQDLQNRIQYVKNPR